MKSRVLWGFLLFSLAAVPGGYCWHLLRAPAAPASHVPLPVYAVLPDFTLADQEGHPFTLNSLRGQVWVADFIFTSCAGACPVMTTQMTGLQKELPPEIHLVSVTVDPARDTSKILKSYAVRHGADPARWHFLTGPAVVLTPLIQKGFRLSVAEGTSPEEPIAHSQRFVLIDRAGQIRGYYDSTDRQAMKRLVHDAGSLSRSS